jgi:hypothetical protein
MNVRSRASRCRLFHDGSSRRAEFARPGIEARHLGSTSSPGIVLGRDEQRRTCEVDVDFGALDHLLEALADGGGIGHGAVIGRGYEARGA